MRISYKGFVNVLIRKYWDNALISRGYLCVGGGNFLLRPHTINWLASNVALATSPDTCEPEKLKEGVDIVTVVGFSLFYEGFIFGILWPCNLKASKPGRKRPSIIPHVTVKQAILAMLI